MIGNLQVVTCKKSIDGEADEGAMDITEIILGIIRYIVENHRIYLVIIIGLGYVVPQVRRRWVRYAILILVSLLGPMLTLLAGITSGCAYLQLGIDCHWFGFLMVMMLVTPIPSALAVGMGMFFRHIFNPVRPKPGDGKSG